MTDDGSRDELGATELLERYVTQLLENRAPEIPPELDRNELMAYMMAAELSGTRSFTRELSADTVARIEGRLRQAIADPKRVQRKAEVIGRRFSRRQALTAAAGMGAGVLVGVALDRSVPGLEKPQPSLVGPNGRWYEMAAAAELADGSVRRFSAGGVDGYLIKEGNSVRAVSAICTHMGCHINWHDTHARFECLCHGAAFDKDGQVIAGIPPSPLPSIHVRVRGGRVYAWGTHETNWG